MTSSARTSAQTIDAINTLRLHISRAEAAGAISHLFALRLRLQADKAEARLQPPTRMVLAFRAVDKLLGKAVGHGAY